ncbi:hypothetical protein EJB05_15294, partial [Eragrostis curvula]
MRLDEPPPPSSLDIRSPSPIPVRYRPIDNYCCKSSTSYNLKMIRRYVNLVVANRSTRTYSLHRLDVAKYLFYPSTAEAEAANAANKNSNGSVKPSRIGRLRRLPPASMCFRKLSPPKEHDPSRWFPDDMFTLLSPGSRSSEGRILHISDQGPAVVYDADTRSTSTVPSLHGSWGGNLPIFIPIAGDGEERNRLYMIHKSFVEPSFQVLDLNQHRLKWEALPPAPPFTFSTAEEYCRFDGRDCRIVSVTVVDRGQTICVSTDRKGTFCFDTRSRKWWQACHWALPFDGRPVYVPELDTWIGLSTWSASAGRGHLLCASSDLSAMKKHQAPTLQHIWEDLTLPKEQEKVVLNRRFVGAVVHRSREWVLENHHLINLGGGRFCLAKVFTERRRVSVGIGYDVHDEEHGPFVVLTGVEVLPGGDDDNGEAGLRMVKHKSKRYMSTENEIKWVL